MQEGRERSENIATRIRRKSAFRGGRERKGGLAEMEGRREKQQPERRKHREYEQEKQDKWTVGRISMKEKEAIRRYRLRMATITRTEEGVGVGEYEERVGDMLRRITTTAYVLLYQKEGWF